MPPSQDPCSYAAEELLRERYGWPRVRAELSSKELAELLSDASNEADQTEYELLVAELYRRGSDHW